MSIDLKAQAPDATVPDTAVLFGADSQAVDRPSVFPMRDVLNRLYVSSAPGDPLALRTPNGGSVTVGGAVNVIDFIPEAERAAIRAGTSTFDCTAQLQAAFDAVGAGGVVLIPSGVYIISSALNVKKSIVVRGSSVDNTTIRNVGAGNTLYVRDTTVPTYTNAAVIEHLTLQGNNSSGVGIYCDPVTYCKFLNLSIKDHGSHGVLLNGSYFNVIDGCNIRSNAGYGIVVQNSSNANTISNTSASYNGAGGLRFTSSDGLCLVQFDAEVNVGWGIELDNAAELYMLGGWIESNTLGGLRAYNGSEQCSISGSFRVTGSTTAIKLESAAYVTIASARCGALIDIDSGCSNTKIIGLLSPPFINNQSATTFFEGLPLAVGNAVTGPSESFIPLGKASVKSMSWTGTAAVSTGVNINPGDGGKTILAVYSVNAGGGNVTASSVYMIRTGHSGNNFTATKMVGDDGGTGAGTSTLTFSQSSGVLTVQNPVGGNHRLAMFLSTPT